MFNLGLTQRERQEKMSLTVINRGIPWSNEMAFSLAETLSFVVYTNPQHLKTLVIEGVFSKETIADIVGFTDFTHKIVTGYNNPELPFRLPAT